MIIINLLQVLPLIPPDITIRVGSFNYITSAFKDELNLVDIKDASDLVHALPNADSVKKAVIALLDHSVCWKEWFIDTIVNSVELSQPSEMSRYKLQCFCASSS